jgi:hypothetical protein
MKFLTRRVELRPDQVSDVINYCQRNMCTPNGRRVCFLCGSFPEQCEEAAVGVFIADEAHQKRVGAPLNKTRLMIYLLCEECNGLHDRNTRVQGKIFAEVTFQ